MLTIQINNSELEQYISLCYGEDKNSLVNDFVRFLKMELYSNDIKKAFEEVAQFNEGKIPLSDATDFLSEVRNSIQQSVNEMNLINDKKLSAKPIEELLKET